MKKVVLNWMPPGMIEMPSPSMSILKQYLGSNGYPVEVAYWNIKLNSLMAEFVWQGDNSFANNEFDAELLFYNYLAIKSKDATVYARIKAILISKKPQYLAEGSYVFNRHMETYAKKLDKFIDEQIDSMDLDDALCIGMSVNLYQWICSSIIARKIKDRRRDIPIVIGGIGTKESAISFLNSFEQFDIALWGEGEASSLKLVDCLDKNSLELLPTIPNIAYRDGDIVETSNEVNHTYIDLSTKEVLPDFEDYFAQMFSKDSYYTKDAVSLFVESSRSCHWRRCQFCYLNTGYKYRLKSIQTIDAEIREAINKYHVHSFNFLDNDLIGNDMERFDSLLNTLIAIKDDYPRFRIGLAEIITKGIEASYIRKMAMAGFVHVQIGYESASNAILKKIHKKNTFASNLLFIKFASKYNIAVGGVNIIRGLLEETTEDILEAIENLHCLRFFFKGGLFRHSMTNLGVMHSSRYYNAVSGDNDKFKFNTILEYLLPQGYIKQEEIDKCTIIEKMCCDTEKMWDCFSAVEAYYLKNQRTYQMFRLDALLLYQERLNNEIVNELEIEYSSLEYLILENSNKSILEFSKLTELMSDKGYKDMLDCELCNILENMKDEGLIYTPSDYSELIAIVDIDSAI
ncbi:MAG: B12-binding domain-containing radical SAM protein [Mediterranea sp.]|jgi:radical SAM superfamily enzyme YgiQ (UPF0313 family)|nr:B12-binding domain-containing radical SAM protein [Mediterranea sp.]